MQDACASQARTALQSDGHTEAWAAKEFGATFVNKAVWGLTYTQTERHTGVQTDRQADRQTVAHLEMLWGDLGGEGGGAQASGGHLVEHLSNEAAVLGVLFSTCLFASSLLILTAPVFDNASVICTCMPRHEVMN